MRIQNRKKFVARILELVVIIATIILTIIAVNYANKIRGHQAFGGEYLVPIFGLIIILVIEGIYEDSEYKKRSKKYGKR